MDYLNFFSHKKISDTTYIFTEGYSMVHRFTIGVIVGTEKVLVIDAGLGETGELRHEIEKVVGRDKPIICACTHGHIDHFGGAKLFDEVWLGEADFADAPKGLDYERRLQDVWSFSLDNKEVNNYCAEHALHNEDTEFIPLEDGHIFDLGGVTVEAIDMGGGHSLGSMVFYIEKDNLLFTGDAINADCYIARLTPETYPRYIDKLDKLMEKVGEDIVFYSGHLPLPQKIGIIRGVRDGCAELLKGHVAGDVPFVGIHTPDQTTPRTATSRYKISGNALVLYNPKSVDPQNTYDIGTMCLYGHEKVSEHVYVITENNSVVHRLTIGLVVGEKCALVIDTGLGMNGRLREYIEGIIGSDKPIICALTHGAVDHAGAAGLFDSVFLSKRDWKLMPTLNNDVDRRLYILYSLSLKNTTLVDYCRDKFLPIKDIKYKNLADGDIFDLGGVRVETVPVPGHTEGSVAFLVRSDRVAFTGDAVNADTWCLEMNEDAMRDYAKTLRHFADFVNDDEVTIYAGHLNRGQTFDTVYDLINALNEVADGETEGDPPGQSSFIFEGEIPSRRMHYHGNTCVVYDRANFKR